MKHQTRPAVFVLFCAVFIALARAFLRWHNREIHRAIHQWRGSIMREAEALYHRLSAHDALQRELDEESV